MFQVILHGIPMLIVLQEMQTGPLDMWSYVRRNIKGKNSKVRESAYNTLVRPQLERFCGVGPTHKRTYLLNRIDPAKSSRWTVGNFDRQASVTEIGSCLRLEVTGVPDPTPFSITVRMHTWTGWNFLSSPGQLQFGMDLQPKLSLRRQLMGLSPKYNDLGLGKDMAWYACPWGLLVNCINWGGFVKDLYWYLFLVLKYFMCHTHTCHHGQTL